MPQHDDDIIPHQDEVEQVIRDEVSKDVTVVSVDGLVTPEAGWAIQSEGLWWVEGTDLCISNLSLEKTAATAFAIANWAIPCKIPVAFRPDDDLSFSAQGVGEIGKYDQSQFVICRINMNYEEQDGETPALLQPYFYVPVAFASAARTYFKVVSLRYPLADVDAAKTALAAL